VLGRELPGWGSKALNAKWWGAFAPHVVRLLIGTYWGGIRRDWGEAEFLTNDRKTALTETLTPPGRARCV
jgi:hypothetical protein